MLHIPNTLLWMHRLRDCPPAPDFANPASNSDYLTPNDKGYEAFTQGKDHRAAMQLMPHVVNGAVPGQAGKKLTDLICM